MLGPQTTRRTPKRPDVTPPSRRDTEDIFAAESGTKLPHSRFLRSIPAQLGQYQILGQLGKGGMARVFLAEHVAMKRLVAIKVLPEELARNRAALERFYREARNAAALDHPNIVRAYDVREAQGFHFLVMEYVEGQDLEAIMNARPSLPIADAVSWISEAAKGLEHAAEKKIVHRDIKPSNLLLDKHGTIKILDMGLARVSDEQNDRVTDEFDSGAVMCTPDYAAPEQVVRADQVDTRADIYALGATLYALLIGRPPFEGSVTMKLVSHQAREAIPVHKLRTDIPRELSSVVAKMMAKKPEDRYQTAAAVVDALKPWRQKTIPMATAANEWEAMMDVVEVHPHPIRTPQDRRRTIIMGIVALLPVLLIVALMLRQILHVVRA